MAASRGSLIGLVALVLGVSAASQWWGHRQDAALGAQVAALAAAGELRMLASDSCAICARREPGSTSTGCASANVRSNVTAPARLSSPALRAPGTPVFIVRGQPEIGFNPKRLHERLKPA